MSHISSALILSAAIEIPWPSGKSQRPIWLQYMAHQGETRKCSAGRLISLVFSRFQLNTAIFLNILTELFYIFNSKVDFFGWAGWLGHGEMVRQGSLVAAVHGVLQARMVEWFPCSSLGDLPTQGSNLHLYVSYIDRQVPLAPPENPRTPQISVSKPMQGVWETLSCLLKSQAFTLV